jgi:hypothetical protein
MAKRSIKTIAGLQRACEAYRRRVKPLYRRAYILQPALARHLARFEDLETITDHTERFQAFRSVPALEYELEAVDAELPADKRKSLAQQNRARRSRARLTDQGITLVQIARTLIEEHDDPWALKAKEYWVPLIGHLQKLGLNPKLISHPNSLGGETLEYDGSRGRRSLTPGQFANIISEVRQGWRAGN